MPQLSEKAGLDRGRKEERRERELERAWVWLCAELGQAQKERKGKQVGDEGQLGWAAKREGIWARPERENRRGRTRKETVGLKIGVLI